MRATRTAHGWALTGDAPFVSGWGIVDVLVVSAADVETDDVIGVIVDARPQPGIARVDALHLVAATATNTVSLRLDDLTVSDEMVVSRVRRDEFLASQLFGARLNGTLPTGLARRCARLLDDRGHVAEADRVRARCDAVRGRLDAGLADTATMVAARADGPSSRSAPPPPWSPPVADRRCRRPTMLQRLAREAVFTLVAASRAELKRELLGRFADTPTPSSATT